MIDYFDASAVAAIVFNESGAQPIADHLAASGVDILVSDFVVAEVSSAVSRLVRMRQQSAGQGRNLLDNLDDWVAAACDPISVEAGDIREAIDLIRDFALKLRAPDALHIVICRRVDARLVTLDKNMARAATSLGVACINPAESSA